MSDQELEYKLRLLVTNERAITSEILELILAAESRGLPLQRGFTSTLEWLVCEFKYSESAAFRRIQAARLLKDVPELKAKLASGNHNLTNLSKIQSVMKRQEKLSKVKFSPEAKATLVRKIEDQTGKEAEETLFNLLPNACEKLREDRIRQIDSERSQLTVTLSTKTVEQLSQIRDSMGGKYVDLSLSDLISTLISRAANGLVKKQSRKSTPVTRANTAAVKRSGKDGSRKIPSQTRRLVQERAANRCEYVDPLTRKQCGSQRHLEVDHIHPWSLGGSHAIENLRLLCRSHNQMFAKKYFGHLVSDAENRKRVT